MPESSLEELGRYFGALAALLRGEEGIDPPEPDRVLKAAHGAVSTAEHAGLTLLRDKRRPHTLAASSDVVLAVDLLQYELGEGPCLEAADRDDVVRTDDLAEERRWGTFGPVCVERTGIRSMMCVRLSLSRQDRAAMNLYAASPGAFTARDETVAALFAPFVAMALQGDIETERADQLTQALHSSRQIGTAIGIVMARELVTEEEAFQRLVHASQHLNVKLRDVAERVKETGAVPG